MGGTLQQGPAVAKLIATQWKAYLLLSAAIHCPASYRLCVVVGGGPPVPFTLVTQAAAVSAVCGLALPVLILGALDRMPSIDARAWPRQLGSRVTSILSSGEAVHVDAFVLMPLCSHSSHAQVAAGCMVIARAAQDARARTASFALGASLVVLGAASHVWWASLRRRAQWLDNLMMEVHLALLIAVVLSLALPPVWEWRLLCAVAAIWGARGLTFGGIANLLALLTLLLVAACLWAATVLGGSGDSWRFVSGLGLALYGTVVKAADAAREACPWGTAAFHYCAAAGFALLFLWAQTLPVQ